MGKILETKINRFNSGIVNDPRDKRSGVAQMVTNFDAITNPRKLSPYRSVEDGDSGAADNKFQNFAIAENKLFALGVISDASSFVEVKFKNITLSGSPHFGDAVWIGLGQAAKHQGTSGVMNAGLFTYYKKTGLIYCATTASNQIMTYDPTGSADFDETHRAITMTNVEEGLVHSKDDILYIPYDNILAKNDNGSWTNAVLTFPTHYTITSIAEKGNFLAVGCKGNTVYENSIVYLWDRDSSLETLSESIDWGDGDLKIIHQIDGELIGISIKNGSASFEDRVIFRRLIGGVAVKFLELRGGINTTILPTFKRQVDNRLFFQMRIEINGEFRAGLWSIGRSSPQAPLTLINDYPANGDTAYTVNDQQVGFSIVGDFAFMSMLINSVWKMNKTSDTSTAFADKSIYESQIFETEDASLKKDLRGITITTEPLPTNGKIVLQYSTDEDIGTNTWTDIFTETTDDSISFSAVTSLPKDYKAIQFRIESTGNAEPTSLNFQEEVTGKRNYN